MPYHRLILKKELEIVSLIDVVFMLIIFGLVISVIGFVGKDEGPPSQKKFSIVIQRAPRQDRSGQPEPERLMVSFLDENGAQVGDTASFPIDDSLSVDTLDAGEFDGLRPCRLIREQVTLFAQSVRGRSEQTIPERATIHIEVTPDTKTRIVHYITRQCIPFQDNIGWVRLAAN